MANINAAWSDDEDEDEDPVEAPWPLELEQEEEDGSEPEYYSTAESPPPASPADSDPPSPLPSPVGNSHEFRMAAARLDLPSELERTRLNNHANDRQWYLERRALLRRMARREREWEEERQALEGEIAEREETINSLETRIQLMRRTRVIVNPATSGPGRRKRKAPDS